MNTKRTPAKLVKAAGGLVVAVEADKAEPLRVYLRDQNVQASYLGPAPDGKALLVVVGKVAEDVVQPIIDEWNRAEYGPGR